MIVRDERSSSRTALSGPQRALLEQRLLRARQSAGEAPATRTSIPHRKRSDDVPLSFAQERLWFLDQLEPGSAVYNVCQAVRIEGTFEPARLERALNEIIRRHEILRTNFLWADGRPVQVVAPERTLTLTVDDSAGQSHAALSRRLLEESRRPFDLARDLLLRGLLVRIGSTEYALMLTMHHIISDGWSVGILFRELAILYSDTGALKPGELPELPIQYGDYALWEREQLQGPALEKSLAYWKKQLGGNLPVVALPYDHRRPAAAVSRGAAHTAQLSRPLTEALKALGQQEGATLFMTLLAAFHVLLCRWTGQEDIVVGSAVAGRRKAELEKLVGFFVNTLVLRGDLTGSPTFRELLRRMREMALDALAYQDLPFERLVQELRPDRSISRNPLFQVMFVLQNAPMSPMKIAGLKLEPFDIDNGTAKFDLTLAMIETPQGLRASFEYNADLFEGATISRLLDCFGVLLESIAARPDERIGNLNLLSDAERRRILLEFNETYREYPRDQTIAQLFSTQVAQTPDAVAVQFGPCEVSYRALEARANRLGQRLRDAGVGPDVLVGVCLERSIELIVVLLGILKAGGAYVSLDPTYPKERLAYILADTRAPVLVVEKKTKALVEEMVQGATEALVVCVESDPGAVADGNQAPPVSNTTAENLAYVSYTSGTTGHPKGVCVPNRGVVRLVKGADYARFGADEVFLQYAPVAFDASTLEIWGALLNGAKLVVMPPGPVSLSELGATIETSGVTTLWLTAGLFNQMIEEQIERLHRVRQLIAGGDVLSGPHVARALERLPRTQLINGYGPTENTTFTCCHRIGVAPSPGETVPIGRPIANTQVYILDGQLQPVPVGVPGELYAGGDGLARGYLRQPEGTSEKFVAHPFVDAPGARLYRTGDLARWRRDGTIEFLGRLDRQVKIRGFRVEPGEIEAIMLVHPAVKECAVVVRDDAFGAKCLVAYVVSKKMPGLSSETWRTYLEAKVPDYLVPTTFVSLDVLPLSPNGKVDVTALPAPDGGRPEMRAAYIAPRGTIEQQLTEIWEAILGVHPIGVRDRFFDLGGHSLLAVRMVAQVEKRFGARLPVAAIFQHGTVEQMARLLRPNGSRYSPASSLVEIQGHGRRPPVFLVHGVGGGMFWGYSNLARHLGADQPLYAFKSRGLDGLKEFTTIEEMAANYLADLRAHQAHGPYLLGGYCFGGVVAYEMARQIRAQGEGIAMLALMNCSPPNANYERTGNRRSLRWQWNFVRNLGYWFGCFLFRWTSRERGEFIRWKLRLLRKRTVGSTTHAGGDLAMTDVDEMVNLTAYSEDQRRLWQTHVQALRNYRPQPYAGRVTLFRTRGHALLCSFDSNYGWGELAREGVMLKLMPGGHGSILDEPHVQTVARELDRSLRELDESTLQNLKK